MRGTTCQIAAAILAGCSLLSAAEPVVPAWAADAVWYQIFPERFRNGDATNDPTRESLVWPIRPGKDWAVVPWGADWYRRQPWEVAMDRGDAASPAEQFYRNGILDRRYGGDLQGILDKLDYLQNLGVSAMYLNPIFYARSLHKYDGNSLHHVDPYFGPDPAGDLALIAAETADPATWHWTAADKLFLKLIQEAKARGIRVVIDGVFNHTGRDFFAFQDLRRRGADSPYRGWYQVWEFDRPETARNELNYRSWGGYKSLPVFARTPDGRNMAEGPKAYVFHVTRRWMDPDGDGNPSDGIDGWRLDVADELPPDFWADWHRLVRQINPEAFTAAEVWSNPLELIEYGGFSAAMNYHGLAIPLKGFLVDRHILPSKFAEMFESRYRALPCAVALAMMNLMDSHDTDRLASMCVNGERIEYHDPNHIAYNDNASPRRNPRYDIRAPHARERAIQRMVTVFQMAAAGAPMIYYGTEAGMWGGGDPDCRMPMVWPDLVYESQSHDPRGRERTPDPVVFDDALFDFYRRAIVVRRKLEPLRRGDQKVLLADDESWLFALARWGAGQSAVAVFNRNDQPRTLRVELPEEVLRGLGKSPALLLQSGFHKEEATFKLEGGILEVSLPALGAAIVGPGGKI